MQTIREHVLIALLLIPLFIITRLIQKETVMSRRVVRHTETGLLPLWKSGFTSDILFGSVPDGSSVHYYDNTYGGFKSSLTTNQTY